VFRIIGEAFNSPIGVDQVLGVTAAAMVEHFDLKGCHFRLLSRDQKQLESASSSGLSERFINKGPVDAERSVAEALDGRTVLISDCSTDPRIQYPQAFADEGVVSMLTVPLETRGQVIGVMRLFAGEARSFSDEELETVDAVAAFCASAITHSLFHQILGHVTDAIRASNELDEVLDALVQVITEDLRAKGCVIQLVEKGEEDALTVFASYGLEAPLVEAMETNRTATVEGVLAGETVAVLDATDDPRIPYGDLVRGEGAASMLMVPLMVRKEGIGLLTLLTHRPYPFSDDELYLMSSIAEQCGLAVRNAQMYASLKRRYDSVVDDFHRWFEHYGAPGSS
jgi:GAF domain-containing protein